MNKTKMVAYTKYRFDFSSEVGELLAEFSDNHENEKYKMFQLSWKIWTNEEVIRKILVNECNRIEKEGYKGDIWDKMYKSARYYYKKRALVNKVDDNNIIVKRGPNIKFSTNYLKQLNENIVSQLNDNLNDKNIITLSQVEAFDTFCKSHKTHIIDELRLVKQKNGELPQDIVKKVKKVFRNHFYNNRKNIEK